MRAINESFINHGLPPTIKELRQKLGVGSTRTVLRYLRWLEEEGDIERWSGARGLRPLRSDISTVQTRAVPVLGQAPAGPLLVAEQNIDGWVQMPKKVARPGSEYFLLRVRGNSMNKAKVNGQKIEDGDLVLVRQQTTANDGHIVIALIDGEATIKRFARGSGYYVLKPESTGTDHRPIIVERDFRVQGIVVRVLKRGSAIIS
ncbi:MAG TPA: transcriptional repressor LexA [Candidatus Binatia bacterium]|nr:transcriptional repressor LexA [Candidatus Binatia bacterium]